MTQDFGRELPSRHVQTTHRAVTRYLVLIQGPDGPFAKLLLESLDEVAELDANTEEVATTIKGLSPTLGAVGPEWDKALGGCSQREREQAEVYFLPT